MLERSFISVIVPFHDVVPYVERCVEALLAQDYPDDRFEVIFVDNNSTDGSAQLVARHPRVRLLAESKVGSYAARNRGVAEARGAILAFTDSDCAPRSDWLRRIDEALRDPDVALIQGRRRLAHESGGLKLLSEYEAAKAASTFASMTKEVYYGYTNNLAVRRSVFDVAGPFVELLRGADVVFVHRVIEVRGCAAIRYVSEMCVTHLEVASVGAWWRKMRIYGRSSRGYGPLARSRPLRLGERLRVFRATVRDGRLSLLRSLQLILILIVGVVYYEWGRRSR